ncbi:glycine cleavage system protein R [Paraglaciecola sp. MB-3u-78]|jgi:glycine cleavage system transcriptional repressor|uniref:glycine cleavage system protein R n=1 Tax=Paraglaciecola sp. MB-3u-78 TaxID=2058332 RepID=UPI000C3452C5|nr:ACT domain-containing protein [Paraglaciecola sp. MB-3u-78]PKG97440.1 glycine cleavage system transcriptional repressor [Paraglaciecola sp. MB-3u-78]
MYVIANLKATNWLKMTQQLIITILGSDQFGVLSKLADTVSGVGCNILDSRQAVYGQDFSLTMIIEGSQSAITQAECLLPQTCQKHNLLSMMKRTKKHCKQNLEHLADVIIHGESTPGLIDQITDFFKQHNISVSAFRLKFLDKYENDSGRDNPMKCKMVISIPHDLEVEKIEHALQELLQPLNLEASIKQNH